MTQPPPPPPNQPPQGGGFGAPQDPPPGGFGPPPPPPQGQPPQPPQGQPGYGYPQQPLGQPGYGYPGAPGGQPGQPGYGFPQQPGQPGQPGYGYPTQPQYTAPGPGGGKKLSTQMQIIIAAAVAVVLIIGGGVWFAASRGDDGGKKDEAENSSGKTSEGATGGEGEKPPADGDGKEKAPANVKSKVAFQLPEPKISDITSVKGSWVTDKAYVKPGVDSIVGYDPAKGTELWKLPLAGQVCGASRHQSADYKTAILFEAAKRTGTGIQNFQPCTEVGVIDMTTGKLLWSKSITTAASGDRKVRFAEVTMSGNTVAAGGLDGGAAFDLTSGAVRWKPNPGQDNCADQGYAGGAALVAVRKCGDYGSEQVSIQPVDPNNGTPRFEYKMPTGVEYASIISTKPLVVAADVGDTGKFGISDFFSIDDSGKLLAKISATGDKFEARCRSTEVESCTKVVVGNGRIYLSTAEHRGGAEYGRTNEIVSYDLATGKPLPGRADAGDKYQMFPLRMDGGHLIAYKVPPYDKGGQIVSIHGGTLKSTVLLENPAEKPVRDAETSFTPEYGEYVYANGRLFISAVLMSKPTANSSAYGKEYLAVGFTTAD
ncbi:PQQ-binding-like beta-propeller repeat protein [Streptomyces sp. NPDC051018]|uniref:outer membrane protein assembly factor BamB family protein n=1 Tax=Streptomyces sp. NPDC051018 TaxID=3365639 RepID=UPI0037A7B22C